MLTLTRFADTKQMTDYEQKGLIKEDRGQRAAKVATAQKKKLNFQV